MISKLVHWSETLHMFIMLSLEKGDHEIMLQNCFLLTETMLPP